MLDRVAVGRRNKANADRRPTSHSETETRRRAQLSRLGIPEGYCKIYGTIVPVEFRDECRAAVARAMRVPANATRDSGEVSREAVRQLITDKIEALQALLNPDPSMQSPLDEIEDAGDDVA